MVSTTVVFSKKTNSRKAIFWAGLIFAASVGSAVFIFPAVFPEKKGVGIVAVQDGPKSKNRLLLDSDQDGLQNWEEELYKTNPDNPDTDGDGTPDGEEIKLGRNPALAGPDDAMVKTDSGYGAENQNLTNLIFEEFMTRGGMAALLNQERPGNTEGAVAQKVDEFLKSGRLPAQKIDQLEKAQNLQTSPVKNAAAINNYLQQVSIISDKYTENLPEEDDLDLFLAIIEAGEDERLKELAPYRELAEKTAKELRSLTVPQDFEELHGRMVWYLEETAKQLNVLEKADKDPAAALAIVPARIDLKIQAAKFYEELSQELETAG